MSTKSLERLVDEFNKLPGIGRKTAQRLAFFVMEMDKSEVERFSKALFEVKEKIKRCKICGNLSEGNICDICENEYRDKKILCVVEEPRDVIAMEKSRTFNGLYHVLHGKIDPLNGIGVDDLNLKPLLQRITKNEIEEIILALNPDLEGETTGMYISKLLKPFGIKITKIASGIPMGGNIEFTDTATLTKSLEGRIEVR
ncbi:MAG: recombination protein RecR [Fusobacteriia bacterium 4572_132]|nr:MAG: recombination protein RecR [Fusobacteriia bacterium 4572_132]